jgi:hypothetical protein
VHSVFFARGMTRTSNSTPAEVLRIGLRTAPA